MPALELASVILVALAMAPALAHALEFPGKRRLDREAYLAVQPIYYPGFTILGAAEPLGLVATAILLVLTPRGTQGFWLTLVAALGLAGMQVVYWTVTHPVNRFWLRGEALGGAGAGFFAADPARRARGEAAADPAAWTALRDRWEWSHVARAALALVSLVALLVAVAR